MAFWSMISAGIIALFWTFWYFVIGPVPTTDKIQFTEGLNLNLPSSVSRWWDVLIGLIGSICVVALRSTNKQEHIDFPLGVGIGVVLGLFLGFSLECGAIQSITGSSLFFGFGLLAGAELLAETEFPISMAFGLTLVLTVGVVVGLFNILPALLVMALPATIVGLLLIKLAKTDK